LPDRGRPRPGKPSLDLRRFDLVKLVSMAVVACESQAQAHRVRLRCVLPPGPLEVVVDPLRITQVVTHLVSNAIECSPPDAEVVVLATESEPHFVVRVQDQGCGIEPVLLPRILDVFTRADDAEEGAGAGLGVVKEIVRLHGGSVEVRSDGAGAGSEFCVRIPIAGSDAAGAPRAAVPCASDTGDGIGRA
jgi:two-component system CheB/CheR fusion protein